MQSFHNFELRATSNFESSFSYKTAVMSIKTLGIFILLAYCIFPPSPAPLVRETHSNSTEPPAKLSGFFSYPEAIDTHWGLDFRGPSSRTVRDYLLLSLARLWCCAKAAQMNQAGGSPGRYSV